MIGRERTFQCLIFILVIENLFVLQKSIFKNNQNQRHFEKGSNFSKHPYLIKFSINKAV